MALVGNTKQFKEFFDFYNLKNVYLYLEEILIENTALNNKLIKLDSNSFVKDHEIDNCMIFLQSAITKNRLDCFFESHKKYVDIQMIVNGIEQMEYININKLNIMMDYDEEKDLIKYDDNCYSSKIILQSTDLAIFFPTDGHMGQSMFNEESLIKKVVVKVPLSTFETKEGCLFDVI